MMPYISEKTIKAQCLPIYLVHVSIQIAKDATEKDIQENAIDENYKMPSQLWEWNEKLSVAVAHILEQDRAKASKIMRSMNNLIGQMDRELKFSGNKEISPFLYAVQRLMQNIIAAGVWNPPEGSSDLFFDEIWPSIDEYLNDEYQELLQKGEKSADKMAGKILAFLQTKGGLYQ